MINFRKKTIVIVFFVASLFSQAQRTDNRIREYLSPLRVVWTSDSFKEKSIINSKALLEPGIGQANLINDDLCELVDSNGVKASLVLDFGKELHGGIEIVTGRWRGNEPKKIRLRFGESVSEVMSDIDVNNARNDHAIRDEQVLLPWLGKKEIGNTGFRFVRIDLLETNSSLFLKEVNAISIYRDIPYLGSFECSDTLLNKIWQTGAYTVHLNMQNFLWDGIKRDRLVWVGDMHPEVMTINSVFGYNEVVPKSLDMIRDNTPLPAWMNGISSYSMWWVLIHYEWYMSHGDLAYLKNQTAYMKSLLEIFCSKVDENGQEHLDGNRFLDWPSSPYPLAIDAGYEALLKMTLDAGAKMMQILNESQTAGICQEKVQLMTTIEPLPHGSKQAASLLLLADLLSPNEASEIILKNGAENFSTFYGYYMLQALADSKKYTEAIDIIREYWGGMLKLGATTFWEDFDVSWLKNAGRIDELPQEGKIDVHATYGDYCYVKLRHSFCHGWASGPTPWLSEHVLGIQIVEPGMKKIRIQPNLGDLDWAKGKLPTPYGLISVQHSKGENGKITTHVDAPDDIEIIHN